MRSFALPRACGLRLPGCFGDLRRAVALRAITLRCGRRTRCRHESEYCPAVPEARPASSDHADKSTFVFEGTEHASDTGAIQPRLDDETFDAHRRRAEHPSHSGDAAGIVTWVGHGLLLVWTASARARSPVRDVAYARSWRDARSDTERPCDRRRSRSVDVNERRAGRRAPSIRRSVGFSITDVLCETCAVTPGLSAGRRRALPLGTLLRPVHRKEGSGGKRSTFNAAA